MSRGYQHARRRRSLGGSVPIMVPSRGFAVEDLSLGEVLAALTVVNGDGVYTPSIVLDADNKFVLDGSNLKLDGALDWETKQTHRVTIEWDNGVDPTFQRIFTLRVLNAIEVPVILVAPVVTGNATVGETLSCSTGAWTDMADGTYEYQWYDASDDSELVGETDPTYLVPPEMEGESVYCIVTPTNSAGAGVGEASNTVGPFEPAPEPGEMPLLWGAGNELEWDTGNTLVWE